MAEEDLSLANSTEQQIIDSIDKKMIVENGLHEETNFSDPEDFVDDISDEGKHWCLSLDTLSNY